MLQMLGHVKRRTEHLIGALDQAKRRTEHLIGALDQGKAPYRAPHWSTGPGQRADRRRRRCGRSLPLVAALSRRSVRRSIAIYVGSVHVRYETVRIGYETVRNGRVRNGYESGHGWQGSRADHPTAPPRS